MISVIFLIGVQANFLPPKTQNHQKRLPIWNKFKLSGGLERKTQEWAEKVVRINADSGL